MTTQSSKTRYLTMSAIFAALIYLFTAIIFHIPTPYGYMHFGNTLIFLVGALLPTPYAFAASAIGCGIADLMTAPIWVIPTVIIKGTTAIMLSSKTEKIICPRNIVGLVLAYLVNVVGYYIVTGLMYKIWAFDPARIFSAIISPIICAILFVIIGKIMDKTNFKQKVHL